MSVFYQGIILSLIHFKRILTINNVHLEIINQHQPFLTKATHVCIRNLNVMKKDR